jgi:hypothetical protein
MSKELHRLAQGKEGTTVALTLSFFSPMTKSGASPKTTPSPTCALSETIGPKRIIPTACASPLAEIQLITHTSMPNAKFGGADIKNMYLKTPLNQYK